MKRTFKSNAKLIIGIIIGEIIFGSLGVYAATVIAASGVEYTDNNSLGATNVQDAIDKLSILANNHYETDSTGTMFASKMGVCIFKDDLLQCLKANNFSIESGHIREVIPDGTCSVNSVRAICSASDFTCNVSSSGSVTCKSDDSVCSVTSSGSFSCS